MIKIVDQNDRHYGQLDITSMVSNCDDHESSMFPEVMFKFREVMVMLLEVIQKVVC